MQKVIPPRLVEPYLAGRRTVISGFVYRAADSSFGTPAEFYDALGLGYPGSDFTRDAAEIYVLRWIATDPGRYRIPYPAGPGGGWPASPPFTAAGLTSYAGHRVAEFYTDTMPVPVGAEIYRIAADGASFVARFDGQAWIRPREAM